MGSDARLAVDAVVAGMTTALRAPNLPPLLPPLPPSTPPSLLPPPRALKSGGLKLEAADDDDDGGKLDLARDGADPGVTLHVVARRCMLSMVQKESVLDQSWRRKNGQSLGSRGNKIK